MLKSLSEQTATRCGNAFPEVITCLEGADSPAVYLVNNLVDSGWAKKERVSSGLHWHTDIEFERVPLSTSMFYVQTVPRTRDHAEQWVPNQLPEAGFYHPASSPELMSRRLDLPLNGETAYADSAAAFADLPRDQQLELLKVQVRRRLKVGDKGWLIPLVYENPRNGMLSLHSQFGPQEERISRQLRWKGCRVRHRGNSLMRSNNMFWIPSIVTIMCIRRVM